MTTLVTGGAGYIGSHMVLRLLDDGIKTLVVDNLSQGQQRVVDKRAIFRKGDVGDYQFIRQLISEFKVTDIIHFAGATQVNESFKNPLHYYQVNGLTTHALLRAAVAENVSSFIFSSTAAVYGGTQSGLRRETDGVAPLSPYGKSKLMAESMVADVGRAHGLAFACLRYFNVAGADSLGRSGQRSNTAGDIISATLRAVSGSQNKVEIFGTDYNTPDGTCIRDYIHVSDLIDIHALALKNLNEGGESLIANCGYGRGYSVRQIVECAQQLSGVNFQVEEANRRIGDLDSVIADVSLIQEKLGWRPRLDKIEEMVGSALKWHLSMDR